MFDQSSNPAFNEKYFDKVYNSSEVMTVSGTVNKCFILFILMVCSATFTWKMGLEANSSLFPLMMAGIIVGTIAAFVNIFWKEASHILSPIYAISEGLALGGVSALYSLQTDATGVPVGNGLVLNALALTLGVLFTMLALYKTGIIKVTEKFKSIIIMATCGIAIGYIASFIFSMLGISSISFLRDQPIYIAISIGIAVIAALNFLLDFERIERGAENSLPAYMEWYCAFGLMLTLVWLYLEILKILSYFSKRR